MEDDNQVTDAVETESIDLITEPIEDNVETLHDVEYVTEKSAEEVNEPVVEESVEESPIEVPHKEDPNRFEYWQSKFSQEQNARKDLESKIQTFENKFDTFTKAPEPEPIQPPVRPNTDDPLDKIEYLEKVVEYNQSLFNEQKGVFDKQQETSRKAQEQAQYKAGVLGEYQNAGTEQDKSMKMYEFFTSEASLDPKNAELMYDAVMGNPNNPKVNQVNAQRVKQAVPLPPGVASGNEQVPLEGDFGMDLVKHEKNNR